MKLRTITDAIAKARKTAATVAGFVAEGVALGVLHGQLLAIATGILALATSLGVYRVENAKDSLLDR